IQIGSHLCCNDSRGTLVVQIAVAEHHNAESPLPGFVRNSSFGVVVSLLGCRGCRVEAGAAALFFRPRGETVE
ncbi:MAG: hypothetical protein WBE84_10345, partial [Xanthobacteraceae bacterium]